MIRFQRNRDADNVAWTSLHAASSSARRIAGLTCGAMAAIRPPPGLRSAVRGISSRNRNTASGIVDNTRFRTPSETRLRRRDDKRRCSRRCRRACVDLGAGDPVLRIPARSGRACRAVRANSLVAEPRDAAGLARRGGIVAAAVGRSEGVALGLGRRRPVWHPGPRSP